jgi:hypothetical protein
MFAIETCFMCCDASCHHHFIREFLCMGKTFFSQSAVFIFVNQQTLLLPSVVCNQLIRKVAQPLQVIYSQQISL